MLRGLRVVMVAALTALLLHPAPAEARRYIVWSSQELPASLERRLDSIPGVSAQPVRLGLGWLTAVRRRGGALVQRAPKGYRFPIEMGVIRPGAYSKWVSEDHASVVRSLATGDVLLSATEADLREAEVGMRVRFGGHKLKIAGIIPDRDAEGYEMLIPPPVPSEWAGSRRTYLIAADPGVRRTRIRKAIVRTVGRTKAFRLRAGKKTEFLRYADMLRPQLVLKRHFGEFAAAASSGTALRLDPGWVGGHIVTDSVPILGRVTCHRKLFPQLRRALRQLSENGNAGTIGSYSGCYNPRFTTSAPGIRISRHTFGLALDINAGTNPYGAAPRQPQALVKTMRRNGFLWGGTWPIPDGMHFEWRRFPN